MNQKLSIDDQLIVVEQQLDVAVECLNTGNAHALTMASEALQNTAVELVNMMNMRRTGIPSADFNTRVGQVASRLIGLRENLLRRSAFVDRALKVVLPTVEDATYQPTRPFGAGPRASGSMGMYSA